MKGTQSRYNEDDQSYLLGLWLNWTLFHHRLRQRFFLLLTPFPRLLLLALVVHSATSPHQQVGPLTVLPWPLGWRFPLESLLFWCGLNYIVSDGEMYQNSLPETWKHLNCYFHLLFHPSQPEMISGLTLA